MNLNNKYFLISFNEVQPKMGNTSRVKTAHRLAPYLGFTIGIGVAYLFLKIAIQASLLRGY